MNNLKVLIPVVFILTIGCNKNNCETVVAGDMFIISDSSKSHLSNYFASEKVFFTNSSTFQQLEFRINQKIDSLSAHSFFVECPENPDELSPFEGTSQFRQIQITNEALNITITLKHSAAFTTPSGPEPIEDLFIVEEELKDFNSIQSADYGLLLVTPTLNEEVFTNKQALVFFGGKDFLNAETIDPTNPGFENDFLSPRLEVAYNNTEGIVQILDSQNNTELVFERFE